jgi:hypothetical protein
MWPWMRVALLSLLFPIVALAQDLTVEGTANVAMAGKCHPIGLVFTAAVSEAAPRAVARLPSPSAVATKRQQHRCRRKMARFCRTVCRGTSTLFVACESCAAREKACEAPPPPNQPDPDGEEVEAQVGISIRYVLESPVGPSWTCELRLTTPTDGEVFVGTCDMPTKAPALDPVRSVYLLPFSVADRSANNAFATPSSFGNFRGYLVVTRTLVEAPDTATPDDIRGVTGELTYWVGAARKPPYLWHAPWKVGRFLPLGYLCLYSGRLHFGDIAQY